MVLLQVAHIVDAYMAKGEWEAAGTLAKKALKTAPTSPELLFAHARFLLRHPLPDHGYGLDSPRGEGKPPVLNQVAPNASITVPPGLCPNRGSPEEGQHKPRRSASDEDGYLSPKEEAKLGRMSPPDELELNPLSPKEEAKLRHSPDSPLSGDAQQKSPAAVLRSPGAAMPPIECQSGSSPQEPTNGGLSAVVGSAPTQQDPVPEVAAGPAVAPADSANSTRALASQDGPALDAAELQYQRANACLEEGKRALVSDRWNPRIYLLLAEIFYESGQFAESLMMLNAIPGPSLVGSNIPAGQDLDSAALFRPRFVPGLPAIAEDSEATVPQMLEGRCAWDSDASDDEVDEEDADQEPDPDLKELQGHHLRGLATEIYALLVKINAALGWEGLLEVRSEVCLGPSQF